LTELDSHFSCISAEKYIIIWITTIGSTLQVIRATDRLIIMPHHQGEGSVVVTFKYRDTNPNIRLSDHRMATTPSQFIDPLLRLYSPIHKDNVYLSTFTKDRALARTGRGTNRDTLQVMALMTQTFQIRLLDLLRSTPISDQCHLNLDIGHSSSWNNRK
jgi:hypothetical protein